MFKAFTKAFFTECQNAPRFCTFVFSLSLSPFSEPHKALDNRLLRSRFSPFSLSHTHADTFFDGEGGKEIKTEAIFRGLPHAIAFTALLRSSIVGTSTPPPSNNRIFRGTSTDVAFACCPPSTAWALIKHAPWEKRRMRDISRVVQVKFDGRMWSGADQKV